MPSLSHKLLLSILILFGIAEVTYSQCAPIYTFVGQSPDERLGSSLASAGDVNGDGYPDLIIGVDSDSTFSRVFVFSGKNGDTLYAFTLRSAGTATVATAEDVNNDGFADFIIGEPGNNEIALSSGKATVISGLNGDTLHVFAGTAYNDRLGASVASAGDINKDGHADLIVGSPGGVDVGGYVYVFSGLNGDTLHVFNGEAPNDNFGASVASAGDVNNDGFPDIIISAPLHDTNPSGGLDLGRVYVFSGDTGEIIHVFNGEFRLEHFGTIASAGDINNDGYDDLIVGSGGNDASGLNAGKVFVFSGENGDTIHIFLGDAPGDGFGSSVASAGDVNNDGYPDIIVGAPRNDLTGNGAGRAYIFSGINGEILNVINGQTEFDLLGFKVAPAGDVNIDGFDDYLISAVHIYASGQRAGRAYVFLGDGGGSSCSSCCSGTTGNIDSDPMGLIDISDLTFLISHLFINFSFLDCPAEGNVNGDVAGIVDIADLTVLIDHLFINFPPTATCQ